MICVAGDSNSPYSELFFSFFFLRSYCFQAGIDDYFEFTFFVSFCDKENVTTLPRGVVCLTLSITNKKI